MDTVDCLSSINNSESTFEDLSAILSAKVGRSGKMTQARKERGKKMQEHSLNLDYY